MRSDPRTPGPAPSPVRLESLDDGAVETLCAHPKVPCVTFFIPAGEAWKRRGLRVKLLVPFPEGAVGNPSPVYGGRWRAATEGGSRLRGQSYTRRKRHPPPPAPPPQAGEGADCERRASCELGPRFRRDDGRWVGYRLNQLKIASFVSSGFSSWIQWPQSRLICSTLGTNTGRRSDFGMTSRSP